MADTFLTRSGRQVLLQFFVEPGKLDQGAFALGALKKAMKWDEETYGLEVDLDQYNIVAVGDFNAGAMENKGLNVFNTNLVLAEPIFLPTLILILLIAQWPMNIFTIGRETGSPVATGFNYHSKRG
jgi:hypothetical protein